MLASMAQSLLHPWIFERTPVAKPWAGHALARLYPALKVPYGTGECVEIADNEDFSPVVTSGPAAGQTINALAKELGTKEVFGKHKSLPLMLKLIDTAAPLSVQVHPGDQDKNGKIVSRGKTEAWLILEASHGASIWQGMKTGVSNSEFWTAMRSNQPDAVLNRREVKRGDCLLSPAGMVHAIGAGIALVELQQNVNTTFRINDWGRRGNRELHLDEAKHSARLELAPPPVANALTADDVELCSSRHFVWRSIRASQPLELMFDSFRILTCLEGKAELTWRVGKAKERMSLEAPSSVFLPAGLKIVKIEPEEQCWLLEAKAS